MVETVLLGYFSSVSAGDLFGGNNLPVMSQPIIYFLARYFQSRHVPFPVFSTASLGYNFRGAGARKRVSKQRKQKA